jgi:hypothetical protein
MKAAASLLLFATCMLAGAAWASSARFGDPELVEHSDLIVSATLVRIERQAGPGSSSPAETGILDVRHVLKGAGHPRVVRLVLSPAGALRSSSDIHYSVGQKGLWFLRATPGADGTALYRADHPQRFLPEEEATPRMRHFQDLVRARRPRGQAAPD